ncbi:Transglutaminase-like protein [Piromyces finnis]|uniref:Transglutaminase-like protein n=1 Tax=Piromyces finnis TaxID=1754191 RepID=A0A1Y1V0D8_9FUNG|nr:Transglutaminase-like protein [Piromyces finnis]|eukprot:ORX44476.1 Transglutaminase-like protein [Piromyces finnis]
MYEEYLKESEYINYHHPEIEKLAKKLKNESKDDIDYIQKVFYFVRDEIHHSADVQDKQVTVTASDCLEKGVGICWVKSYLFAALLRIHGIPSGFSHQRLTLGNTLDSGYCIHSLNTVYIASLGKWIRLDARGNNESAHSEFSLDKEILAYRVTSQGEKDYFDNIAEPDPGLIKVLKENTDAHYMYSYCLPDRLTNEQIIE